MTELASLDHSWQELIAVALDARRQAYARYSNFLVGAALRATDGTIFRGCNVENASYGLTQCAERTALTSAVAAGSRQFTQLVIAASGAVTPCGACRQVLAEFCRELPILLVDADQPQHGTLYQLSALLPGCFELQPDRPNR